MKHWKQHLGVALTALVAGAIGGVTFSQVSNLSAANSAGTSSYVAVQPQQRALDTREAGDITGGNPVTEGQTLQLKIAGEFGVPAGADSVQLNVTVVGGNAASFLTVWDEGDWPGTSTLNWADGAAHPNAVTTAIGGDGFIRLFNAKGVVHVVVDVVGYYTASGPADFEVVSKSVALDLASPGELSGSSVDCPVGKHATGGGGSIVGNQGLDLKTSIPQPDLGGWAATVIAEDPPFSGTLNIYAICASGMVLQP